MPLVTSPSFSILVNGDPTKPFLPSRGILQGEPMSNFLFFIMMEGLRREIKVAARDGDSRACNNVKGAQQQNTNIL